MGKDTTVMKTDLSIFSLEFEKKNIVLVRFEHATPAFKQKMLALRLVLRKSRKWL